MTASKAQLFDQGTFEFPSGLEKEKEAAIEFGKGWKTKSDGDFVTLFFIGYALKNWRRTYKAAAIAICNYICRGWYI